MVVSFSGKPEAAVDGKTPPVQLAPAQPDRIGSRPVIIAAREGEHTWKPEYLRMVREKEKKKRESVKGSGKGRRRIIDERSNLKKGL